MDSSTNLFGIISDSGIFGYVLVVYGLVLLGAIVWQFVEARKRDFSQVLWGLILGMLAVGVLGTAMGQVQACGAYLDRADEATAEWLILAWKISLGPVLISSVMGLFFSVATGIAATKARRFATRSESVA